MAQNSEGPHFDWTKVTPRSKKFYDGTYRWNEYGYEDENGVRHAFGTGPDSGPPTPMPAPTFYDSEDVEDGRNYRNGGGNNLANGHGEEEDVPPLTLDTPASASAAPDQSDSHASELLERMIRRTDRLNRIFENMLREGFIDEDLFRRFARTELRQGWLRDWDERTIDQLQGRLEGILIGMWCAGAGYTFKEAYCRVGLEYPDAIFQGREGIDEGEVLGSLGLTRLTPGHTNGPLESMQNGDAGEGENRAPNSPFSNISGMTNVSDPPSVIAEPDASGDGEVQNGTHGREHNDDGHDDGHDEEEGITGDDLGITNAVNDAGSEDELHVNGVNGYAKTPAPKTPATKTPPTKTPTKSKAKAKKDSDSEDDEYRPGKPTPKRKNSRGKKITPGKKIAAAKKKSTETEQESSAPKRRSGRLAK